MKKITCAALFLCLFSALAQAAVKTEEVTYKDNGTELKGYLAYDDAIQGKRPGILVVHEWWGHNDYARKRARMLAELGYTALAIDMYGDGKTANHPDDAGKFAKAVGSDLPLAKARFLAALNLLMTHETVDKDKTAAIGYCFGGGIVLQMARQGVDLDGVVSFHGSVATTTPASKGDVKASVLVYNGADDPFVKPEQIAAFKKEMDEAGVAYDFVNIPGAKHSFTNPAADDFAKQFGMPLAYDKSADDLSWQGMQDFFKKIFKQD
ncbi:dienelactone hydrolase family protein [Sulfuriflexus sp.]|uniref:dienelactone hydrolase family protein n=1 Tax=Sulfuriflexus sp. TaxID=2015443 RepID=UPI0028CD6400|nr:dienelactone hydrolase family protein [Sulfuriflexus sp.]MDT8404042.1 dienelactone hydrolase family protein [Sulfuriflexus sp.]